MDVATNPAMAIKTYLDIYFSLFEQLALSTLLPLLSTDADVQVPHYPAQ